MIYNHISNLFDYQGLAWQLGQIDLTFFCKYFLQDTFIYKEDINTNRDLCATHLEIWDELSKMYIDDKFDHEEFILPRGIAKSTIINKALTTWLHAYKKSRYTCVIGNKDKDAVQFIADTKNMLQNPYIERAFGKLVNNNREFIVNKQEIELTNNTDIRAWSWGSSVRGTTYSAIDGIFRPQTIICDDILAEDDILSDGAKEKVVTKYYKEIAEVGDKPVIRKGKKIQSASKFIIIGTPLAQDDFINTIRKDNTFKVFHRSVVDFNIDEYFENNKYWQEYKTILSDTKLAKEDKDTQLENYYNSHLADMEFPTIWDKYRCDIDIAQVYFNKRTTFMSELMCDCQNIGQKWFTDIKTQTQVELDSNTYVNTGLFVDPASTTTKNSDYTAFIVGSSSDNDYKYVRKGVLDKLSFNEYCDQVIKLLHDFPECNFLYVEKNTYNGTDVIKIKELIAKDKELSNRNITIENEAQHKNKDQKISCIIDDVNSGHILFNAEDVDFINQIKDFAGQNFSIHDDAPDITAEFCSRINNVVTTGTVSFIDKRLLF